MKVILALPNTQAISGRKTEAKVGQKRYEQCYQGF
jgi:hypothetical protein